MSDASRSNQVGQASQAIAWQKLEATVERAAARLRELQQENAELRQRAAELESALAEAGGEGEGRWRQERGEVASRVDSLVERLESILATAAEEPAD